MKKFSIALALLLAFITSGCPRPPEVHQPLPSDVFKNGNYTTVIKPPSVIGGQLGSLIVVMSPVATPTFVCDPVDFTISFPQSDGTQSVIIVSKRDDTLGKYADHALSGYTFVPSQGSATITAYDRNGLPTGEPDTITVTTAPATESTVTNSPIQYPGPNTLGNDITIYSGPDGTTRLAQIQVMDEDYHGH